MIKMTSSEEKKEFPSTPFLAEWKYQSNKIIMLVIKTDDENLRGIVLNKTSTHKPGHLIYVSKSDFDTTGDLRFYNNEVTIKNEFNY